MHLSTLFNIISLAALAVVGVSAQDDGPGFVKNCVTPGQVALTFDDGPSEFTPKLLGYLDAAKVHATFFTLAASIKEFAPALKSAFDAGHQIALHSNTHPDLNTLTPAQILDQYTVNLKAIQDTIGRSPKVARPPFGNCNAACADVLEKQMGLTVIQWNCDSNDWQYEGKVADQPKLFTNIANIINPSNPKNDSFITLQHDIKGYSVEYVPRIIDLIRGKGYTFVTIEQCLGGKVPAYAEGAASAAPAPASSPASSPAAAAPASSPAPAAPASAPAKAGYAESPSPSTSVIHSSPSHDTHASSAGKLSSAFSLTLFCLAFGILY